ncbi:MAG TPA: hypothetical protein VH092_04765, partial [Urbifossiella sp.]|nr:hypothetical protein [Urbifossiella sp.]
MPPELAVNVTVVVCPAATVTGVTTGRKPGTDAVSVYAPGAKSPTANVPSGFAAAVTTAFVPAA